MPLKELEEEDEYNREKYNLPLVDGAHWISVDLELCSPPLKSTKLVAESVLPLRAQKFDQKFPKDSIVLLHWHPERTLNGMMGRVDFLNSDSTAAQVSLCQSTTADPLIKLVDVKFLTMLSPPVDNRAVAFKGPIDMEHLPKSPVNDYFIFPGRKGDSVHNMDLVYSQSSDDFKRMFLAGRKILIQQARELVALFSRSLENILGCYVEVEGVPGSRIYLTVDLKKQVDLHGKTYLEHVSASHKKISSNVLGMEEGMTICSFLGQDTSKQRHFEAHICGMKMQSWSCFSSFLYQLGRLHEELYVSMEQFKADCRDSFGGSSNSFIMHETLCSKIPQWLGEPDPFQTRGKGIVSSMESWALPWDKDT